MSSFCGALQRRLPSGSPARLTSASLSRTAALTRSQPIARPSTRAGSRVTTVTACPAPVRAWQRAAPMKPVPPVTRTRIAPALSTGERVVEGDEPRARGVVQGPYRPPAPCDRAAFRSPSPRGRTDDAEDERDGVRVGDRDRAGCRAAAPGTRVLVRGCRRLRVRAPPATLRPCARAGLLSHRLVPALPRPRRAPRHARGPLAPERLPEGAHQPRARRGRAAPVREGIRLAGLPGPLPAGGRPRSGAPLARRAAGPLPGPVRALTRPRLKACASSGRGGFARRRTAPGCSGASSRGTPGSPRRSGSAAPPARP